MNKAKLNELLGKIFDDTSYSMDEALLYVYSMDASAGEHIPDAVVMPKSRDQIVQLVKLAYENNIPFSK